MAVDNNNNKT